MPILMRRGYITNRCLCSTNVILQPETTYQNQNQCQVLVHEHELNNKGNTLVWRIIPISVREVQANERTHRNDNSSKSTFGHFLFTHNVTIAFS